MCDSQEAAKQNGLCCLETLQEWQNKNLSLYAASSYDGTSRKALFMEQTKQNTCICIPDHLRISRMIKQVFLKIIIFFSVSAACYFPVEVQGEFMTQSLAHQEISYTRYLIATVILSHIEYQAGNKFNTQDNIFLPASPSSTTPFRVGGSATVDMVTGRTSFMITKASS